MSVYAGMPPHKGSAPIDYDNGDVEYTNPGQLAKYDLEHSRPESRRRDSLDRFHRPTSSVSSDIGGRSYNESSRRGPPPTTWGLDRLKQNISSGIYDPPRAPISPLTPGFPRESSRRLSGNLELPNIPRRRRSNSRTRPVSMYQEEERRASPPEPHHNRGRGRDEEQHVRRESRDRDHGRDAYPAAPPSAIEQRGFGLVVDGKPAELHRRDESRDRHRERDRDRYRDDEQDRANIDRTTDERRRERRERRGQYHGEPKRPSDDSLDRVIIRETERKTGKEDHKPRKDSPRGDDDAKDARDKVIKDDKQVREKKSDGAVETAPPQESKRLRDTVAAGLSIAAASIGIGSALKDKDKDKDKEKDKDAENSKAEKVVTVEKTRDEDRGSPRRRDSIATAHPPKPGAEDRGRPPPPMLESRPKPVSVQDEWEMVDPPLDQRRRPSPEDVFVPDARERNRQDSEGRPRDDSADRIVLVERPGEATRASRSSQEPVAYRTVEPEPAASSFNEDSTPTRRFSRRGEKSRAAFRPTDTADLVALKAELAAQDASTKEFENFAQKPAPEPHYSGPHQSNIPPPPPPKDPLPFHEPSPERRRASPREASLERRRPPHARDNSPARRQSPPSQRDDDVEFMDQSGSILGQRNGSTGGSFESTSSSRGRELVGPSDDKSVRVVSPPRDKDDKKPLKGILKPSSKFPEPENFVREGVAPHKDDKTKKDVPAGARWTKIARKLVNPEALTIGKERFEVRDDAVIVLRVLSREEIEAYTVATAQLREMRFKEYEKEKDRERRRDDDKEKERDREREREDERRRTRRREKDDDSDHREPADRKDRTRDRDDEREREKDRERRDRDKDRDRNRDRDRDDERRRPSRRHSDGDDDDDRSGYRSRRERLAGDE